MIFLSVESARDDYSRLAGAVDIQKIFFWTDRNVSVPQEKENGSAAQ